MTKWHETKICKFSFIICFGNYFNSFQNTDLKSECRLNKRISYEIFHYRKRNTF